MILSPAIKGLILCCFCVLAHAGAPESNFPKSSIKLSKKSYAGDHYVVRHHFDIDQVFQWQYGRHHGFLVAARLSQESAFQECMVLSGNRTMTRLLGGSEIHRNCIWEKEIPKFLMTEDGYVLRLRTKVDIMGGNSNFESSFVDLHFDPSTNDFCMYGDRPDNWLKCERF